MIDFRKETKNTLDRCASHSAGRYAKLRHDEERYNVQGVVRFGYGAQWIKTAGKALGGTLQLVPMSRRTGNILKEGRARQAAAIGYSIQEADAISKLRSDHAREVEVLVVANELRKDHVFDPRTLDATWNHLWLERTHPEILNTLIAAGITRNSRMEAVKRILRTLERVRAALCSFTP